MSHPRLYCSIDKSYASTYRVKFYSNRFDGHGNRMIISREEELPQIKHKIDNILCHLNNQEFEKLNLFIKRQEKVLDIYRSKNKIEKLRIVNESLSVFLEFKILFQGWFNQNNNKISL